MRLTQSNRLTMYNTVLKYLKDRMSIVNTIAQFVISLTDFGTTVGKISQKEVERQTVSTGKTTAKYSAEEELIDLTIDVAAGLFTYSRKNNKPEMKELSDTSVRKLDRLKDVDLLTKCTQIYDAAKIVENELIPYGVNPELVAELKEKIDGFDISLGNRNASFAKRIGAGSTLVEMFNEADDILEEELDHFVDKFKKKNNSFYVEYWAARNIRNLGVRHNPPEEPGKQS
jgi:hypothetical protein